MTMVALAEAAVVELESDDESQSAGEGNMVKTLAFLAAWRPCNGCGACVLYVNDYGRTDTRFICGRCMERAERLGRSVGVGGAVGLGLPQRRTRK